MKKLYFILIILFLVSCKYHTKKPQWNIVYKSDKLGNTLIGSKQGLIDAIRNGNDIKIGWGLKGENHSIEHLSTPVWLAILDEKEVIAHLDPQVLSSIDWDNASANYKNVTLLKEEWRVVITTKGEFDAIWYDKKYDSVIKRRPQNHTMTWFSKNIKKNIQPLFNE